MDIFCPFILHENHHKREKHIESSRKNFEHKRQLDVEIDNDVAVLYLSIRKPQPSLGIDIGEGIVVRYDEIQQKVTGLTIIRLRHKLLREINVESN